MFPDTSKVLNTFRLPLLAETNDVLQYNPILPAFVVLHGNMILITFKHQKNNICKLNYVILLTKERR